MGCRSGLRPTTWTQPCVLVNPVPPPTHFKQTLLPVCKHTWSPDGGIRPGIAAMSTSGPWRVAHTDEKGRHLVATRQIRAGEVVLSQPAYAAVLYDAQRSSRCDCCMRESEHLTRYSRGGARHRPTGLADLTACPLDLLLLLDLLLPPSSPALPN